MTTVKVAIVAGAHGSGKTSLLVHALRPLAREGLRTGVFKVDPRPSPDADLFERHGIAARVHVSGDVCPDHEAMVVLGQAWRWAATRGLDVLAIESGGLCHRCAPFLRRVLAVCVVSGLSNLATPDKMRPLVGNADLVVLTRAEMLSPAEREVFLRRLQAHNPGALVFPANGLTGEGTLDLGNAIRQRRDTRLLDMEPLRATLPTGYCHFCQGIGSGHE